MKTILTILILSLFASHIGFAQIVNTSANIALISSDYTDRTKPCPKCNEVSGVLFNQLKINKNIFTKSDRFPNWSDAIDRDELSRRYSGIDYFLTSTIRENKDKYEIIFVLVDSKQNQFISQKFKQSVKSENWRVDINKITEIIVDELEYFKSKRRFKNAIKVNYFETESLPDSLSYLSEDFAEWLWYELKDHELINVNFHVLEHTENIPNKVEGKFRLRSSKLKILIEIEIDGDKEQTRFMPFDADEYEEKNKNEIIDEILKKIDKIKTEN